MKCILWTGLGLHLLMQCSYLCKCILALFLFIYFFNILCLNDFKRNLFSVALGRWTSYCLWCTVWFHARKRYPLCCFWTVEGTYHIWVELKELIKSSKKSVTCWGWVRCMKTKYVPPFLFCFIQLRLPHDLNVVNVFTGHIYVLFSLCPNIFETWVKWN